MKINFIITKGMSDEEFFSQPFMFWRKLAIPCHHRHIAWEKKASRCTSRFKAWIYLGFALHFKTFEVIFSIIGIITFHIAQFLYRFKKTLLG